ncbi:fungal specific transcription factor domain-containing protein [Cordyceps javanica]|uniref:Fungal specific transcription factor domain-containing protein n=1 Tax=Cordyceps javanica TaxID=43265 RepID=A0A545UR16_9HYPO|nr:fungal specific transcription factor domain-containing protein [Cordyceps javanica]TQW03844.1 fungal specific transcription factor domain protein [Cordyceps javanica]
MESTGAGRPRPSALPQHPKGGDTEHGRRDRRREKPQLSCNFCRSRKGVGITCTYNTILSTQGTAPISVSERIQQLDRLLRKLVEEQAKQQPQPSEDPSLTVPAAVGSSSSAQSACQLTPNSLPQNPPRITKPNDDATSRSPVKEPGSTPENAGSPVPAESGTIRRHVHGTSYVGNEHWAAILDSISELRDQYEEEAAAMVLSSPAEPAEERPSDSARPRLLYEPVYATKADIIATIPPRASVDRMIARYFHAEGVIPEIIHRGQFLIEYEKFWQQPLATPILWIGLLFSVMCLSTQYQQLIEELPNPVLAAQESLFRQQTVFCLILGQYTKGGDYALVTMINYLNSEQEFISKDKATDLWLLQGMIVQIALSLGYHRDARNFPAISPFDGEMRRRVWAVVLQMDLRLSSQVGLPRLVKAEEHDTAEPRNLLDSDFDEGTAELPRSRSEDEPTPILYTLARIRIDKVNRLISDLVSNVQEYAYSKTMELDAKLREAEESMPPLFQWRPLSQSLMVQPQVAMHRVLLQLAIQRQTVWLHRKYLRPAYAETCYHYSRKACVRAAKKILEFQQTIHDETGRGGLLYPVRWIFLSARLHAVYLLAITVLCYYLQRSKKQPDASIGNDDGDSAIVRLLRSSYSIWPRSEAMDDDADKAIAYLGHFLGVGGHQNVVAAPGDWDQDATLSLSDMLSDDMLLEFDWNTYS